MYYSQCGEDKFLNENFFKNKREGVYIELGALDGVLYSNTKFFEDELSWNGILIEPNPDKFPLLSANRANNFLFNNLVSCHTKQLSFRYFTDAMAAVSGVEDTLSKWHIDTFFENNNDWHKNQPQRTKLLTPISLTEIVKKTQVTHIDFFSLDVEGHEYEVLKSWDFSVPIDLILIEVLITNEEKNASCRELLINNGYKFIIAFEHNEIYILKSSALDR